MKETIEKLYRDINNRNIPKDWDNAVEKLKCRLDIGKRIYWYYQEDLELYDNPRDYYKDLYSGIVIPIPGIENNWGELDIEDTVIVIISYPTEMTYPETDWISIKSLLDIDELIEIFDKDVDAGGIPKIYEYK